MARRCYRARIPTAKRILLFFILISFGIIITMLLPPLFNPPSPHIPSLFVFCALRVQSLPLALILNQIPKAYMILQVVCMLVQLVRRLVRRAAATAERVWRGKEAILMTSLLNIYIYFPNSFSNVLHLENKIEEMDVWLEEQKQEREKKEKESKEKKERDRRAKEKRRMERMEKERRDSEAGSFFSIFGDLGI